MSRRPNQVSLKDLFTTNPGELIGARYASDSAVDSASQGNSQFQFSQAEFFDSQDGQQLSHSQNLSQSPTTRFFNRYMIKGPVIGRDSSQSQIGRSYSASAVPKLPSQQQIQLLKARTQEQDERDFWNSLVSGIRECSAEVRVAVACLKESTQLGIGSTECQLTTFMEKIQSSLEKSQSVIVEAFSIQDNVRTKEIELQQQLALKNARIEELENQIQKVMQENQDSIITNLQTTCGDLYHKITENLEPFFCHNQNSLTHLETLQEKRNQHVLDQIKQCLQENFQDQKGSIKSILESIQTLSDLQNENIQKQNGILTSEIMKSLHNFQENQQRGLEELLIRQVKELLEKKELQQKELLEKQHQWFSAIQQEQRQMPKAFQSELQLSNSEQTKHFLSIIEDRMSEEKNRRSQLRKELEHLNSFCQRCGKELEIDKDPALPKQHLRDKTTVICPEAADLLKSVNKNDSGTEQEQARHVWSIPRKPQADKDNVCVKQTKSMALGVITEKMPSAASVYEFSVDPAPAAVSDSNTKFDKDLTTREATGQTSMTSLNSAFKGNKPVMGGKLQLPVVLEAKVVSPLPSGNSRFSGHSHICSDGKVNPSPVALVFPQVQATKTPQLEKDSSLLVASVVRSTMCIPALQAGTTPFELSEMNGSSSTSVAIPAAPPASGARDKGPATRGETSSTSSMTVFTNAPKPVTSSRKTTATNDLNCDYGMQQSNSTAGGRKDSTKKRGKRPYASQSRKRARKQTVVELKVSERCSTVGSRKLVTNNNKKNEKVTTKKPKAKHSVVCKKVSPAAEEYFDFHSDTSNDSDSDSSISSKRIENHKTKLSKYSGKPFEDRNMSPATLDISKGHSARKTPDFLETYSRAVNCHSSYSTRSKSSTLRKTRALPGSAKEKNNSAYQQNNNCLQRNSSSNEGCCSSSASSSPCWSLGDILKLSEV